MTGIRNLRLQPGESEGKLRELAAEKLGVGADEIDELKIIKKSLDARRKGDIHYVFTVAVSLRDREKTGGSDGGGDVFEYLPFVYEVPRITHAGARPVVVGFGPAGIFAALVLSLAGLSPIVLEQGEEIDARRQKVERFWKTGELDGRSNVQFGEGGAGAFSDGKLATGTHDARIAWVLRMFFEAGAGESVLYDAKPHVGTDVLGVAVKTLREKIVSLGGEIRFCTRLTDIVIKGGAVCAIGAEGSDGPLTMECERLILAPGHSARDTFRLLKELGAPMEKKGFSMGVRIEHLQQEVSKAQYGGSYKKLPPSDYKLSCRLGGGGSAYSFCMCPGGYVVAAASEQGGIVTNGMSYSGRAGANANAALLVTLSPEDIPGDDPLAGVYFQREVEKRAFELTGSYRAPAQKVGDFLAHTESVGEGRVSPTYLPGVHWCDLHEVLPDCITKTLEEAIPVFARRSPFFADMDAVMTAPETRSSSPVRILRNEALESAIGGLYPCGEGAGYAGGITSAAVDGMRCAEAVIGVLRDNT